MKWQDAAIIIGLISALLLAVWTLGGKTAECREGAARTASGQLCPQPKR